MMSIDGKTSALSLNKRNFTKRETVKNGILLLELFNSKIQLQVARAVI